ncbi:MAG: hypothetical protein IPM95_08825 [Sphingobacteriales bacterium]|nr:hypothetical protein [Sphingobacteriales bacterium]
MYTIKPSTWIIILLVFLFNYALAQDTSLVSNEPVTQPNLPETPPKKQTLMEKMNQKGFFISGSAGFQLGYSYVSGIPKRMQPFTYQFTGDITFRYKDIIELPFSFVFSEQDRKFNQPFSQFGISPRYKWLTVHGGFRNISWSENSMAGHNMLMIGAEVNPSYFRGGILFGRLTRATIADTAKIDSLHLQTFVPSYKRLGLAIKLGAGTANNYVDLIYFRAWDKAKDSLFFSNDDGSKSLLPKSENAVFNIITSNKIGKYVTLKAEYALSTTNVDRTLPKSKDSADASYPKIAGILMKPNKSAIGGHSANAELSFQKDGWSTNAGFKLLTQNFNTFGAYFLQTNYYDVHVRQVIPLQNQKARLNINMQVSDDNLNRKKPFSTVRAIIQTGYDFNDMKFGISAQYVLAYTKQKGLTDSIKMSPFNDLMMNQMNHTFIVIPRYLIIKGPNTHMLMLSEVANLLTDLNKNTKDNTKFFNNVINLSYTLNLPLKYFSLTGSVYNTFVKNKFTAVSSYGVSVTTSESFAKNKVTISDAVAVTYSKMATVLNFNLNASYSPEKHHRIYLNNGLVYNRSGVATAPSFVELRGTFGYLYSF